MIRTFANIYEPLQPSEAVYVFCKQNIKYDFICKQKWFEKQNNPLRCLYYHQNLNTNTEEEQNKKKMIYPEYEYIFD